MAYAEGTTVPIEKSEAELKTLLRKAKADRIITGQDDRQGLAVVSFELAGRIVRLQMKIPTRDHLAKTPPQHWARLTFKQRHEWLAKKQDLEERRIWRVMLLVTKSKLELIAEGASTVEREFLADIVLPGGQTVHEAITGRIDEAYTSGVSIPMLPGGDG